MGSLCRSSRAEAFINEFGADFVRCCGAVSLLGLEGRAEDRLESTEEEVVRMVVAVRMPDSEILLYQDWVAFDPEFFDREDTIRGLVDALGISRDEARARLERAGLIEETNA